VTDTDTRARGDIWRPFVDEPLLTPPMVLGLDHAALADRERLIAYLSALVATRAVPVHVNVAFNAAYFGFDLTTCSYPGGVELDDLATVDTNGAVDALPVGALIQVPTGSGPLLGEVLYKEGAHPDLGDDGYVPPWLSGAPAGAVGPGKIENGTGNGPVTLRERLIIDVDAFGAGLSLTPTQVARMARRGRVVDPDGHLVVDARYPSPVEADMDESAYYARYLLTTARAQLLAPAVPMPLTSALRPGAPDEQVEAALVGLLDTVQTALGRIEEARTWRGYAFARAGLATRLADSGPLGGQDLRQLANQVEHAAASSRPSRWAHPGTTVAYAAVGPLLRTFAGAGPGLRGLGYATAVCHANAVISDDAHHEVDDDGLLPDRIHLRLDDAWQGGGVWRTEHPGSAHRTIEVIEPLGLGWASTIAPAAPALTPTPTEPEPAPVEEPDDFLVDQDQEPVTELTVTDSQVTWTHILRLSHQIDGRLPLPAPVVAHLRTVDLPGVRMRLSLRHDGYPMDAACASQLVDRKLHETRPCLDGIDWPLEYFPAIVLLCTWPRGGGVVRITSTLLPEPVAVDGNQIEHRYDPRAFTRDQAPGVHGPGRAQAPPPPAGVVLGAVRAAGLLDVQGRATLARARVTDAIALTYGAAPTFNVDQAVDELVRDGALSTATASGTPRRWHLPVVAGEPLVPVVVYTPRLTQGVPRGARHQGGALHRWVAEAHVARHLRRIGHLGHKASAEQAAAYRADHERFGLLGSAELPDGCTYVTEHERRYGK